jgi:hypothetical protein
MMSPEDKQICDELIGSGRPTESTRYKGPGAVPVCRQVLRHGSGVAVTRSLWRDALAASSWRWGPRLSGTERLVLPLFLRRSASSVQLAVLEND